MRPFFGMADLGRGPERAARRGAVERLADLPRPLDVARGDLQIAARQVDADAIAPHAVERLVLRDVAAAGLQRHDHLDLVMQVAGQRRVGHRAAVMHDRVGGLGEEERRLALVLSHLLDVLEIIAPDAPDAPHRKHLAAAGDLHGGLRCGRDDVFSAHRTSVGWSGSRRIHSAAAGACSCSCRR